MYLPVTHLARYNSLPMRSFRAVPLPAWLAVLCLAGCRPQAPSTPPGLTASPGLQALEKELQEKGEIVRRRPANAATEARLGDEELRRRVAARLSACEDPEVPGLLMEVQAVGGHVTLSGRVGSALQLQRTVDFVLGIPGVEGVTARLAVDPDDGLGAIKGAGESPPKQGP